ncbi:MAG: MBL fold metallo-hydrolase [Opitutae bacterium]|nr:MBL fold metallo-hydrolase [Opitutae bacterium]
MFQRNVPPGIHTIRGIMGVCHLLVDAAGGAVFLDTGLVGEPVQMRWLLHRLGLAPRAVQAILLTHGHLDHAGNLRWLKRWTGAPVYAHPAEQAHLDGRYPYSGFARWCGRLERVGYAVLGSTATPIDRSIGDGDELPFWDGLQVVHLPGHTEGHCGFYSARHDVLFSGDLFASYFFNVHLPPPILNSRPELIPASLRRAQALNPRYIVPQHYDILDGELHRRRFDTLCRRKLFAGARG